jgi:LPS export ABC transporter protein LptC
LLELSLGRGVVGRIVIIAFLLALVPSLYLYFSRDVRRSVDKINGKPETPRLIVDDFDMTRYMQGVAKSHLESNKATMTSVNIIDLFDDVRGWRIKNLKKEEFTSNYLQIVMDVRQMEDYRGNVTVNHAYFGKGVSFKYADMTLVTEDAHLLGKENILLSDKPVVAFGIHKVVKGDRGFQIRFKEELLDLFGHVEGTIEPDDHH